VVFLPVNAFTPGRRGCIGGELWVPATVPAKLPAAARHCCCPGDLGSLAAATAVGGWVGCHVPSPSSPHQEQGMLWGRRWLGRGDGKVEQGEGKGAKERSALSQNRVAASILSDLQSLGKMANLHAEGICLGAEEKMDPPYKKQIVNLLLCYLVPMI